MPNGQQAHHCSGLLQFYYAVPLHPWHRPPSRGWCRSLPCTPPAPQAAPPGGCARQRGRCCTRCAARRGRCAGRTARARLRAEGAVRGTGTGSGTGAGRSSSETGAWVKELASMCVANRRAGRARCARFDYANKCGGARVAELSGIGSPGNASGRLSVWAHPAGPSGGLSCTPVRPLTGAGHDELVLAAALLVEHAHRLPGVGPVALWGVQRCVACRCGSQLYSHR